MNLARIALGGTIGCLIGVALNSLGWYIAGGDPLGDGAFLTLNAVGVIFTIGGCFIADPK